MEPGVKDTRLPNRNHLTKVGLTCGRSTAICITVDSDKSEKTIDRCERFLRFILSATTELHQLYGGKAEQRVRQCVDRSHAPQCSDYAVLPFEGVAGGSHIANEPARVKDFSFVLLEVQLQTDMKPKSSGSEKPVTHTPSVVITSRTTFLQAQAGTVEAQTRSRPDIEGKASR